MRDPDLHQPEPHRHHADETTEAKPGLKRVGLAASRSCRGSGDVVRCQSRYRRNSEGSESCGGPATHYACPIFRRGAQLLSEVLDPAQQVLARDASRLTQVRDDFFDAADDRLCDLPVDCLWNPPPAALDLCRRVELILPVCEKLAAVVKEPVP